MSTQDYEIKLAQLLTIPLQQIKPPVMPVDVYLQEAENLYYWCQDDDAALTGVGLDWGIVVDLPVRAGALREAQSIWFKQRFSQEEAVKEWLAASEAGYDLRDQLLHSFRYAYRNHPDLLSRVSSIADGDSHVDMIQDLNDIAVLGQANLDPLISINLDPAQLQKAADTAAYLSDLLARANLGREDNTRTRVIRDRAYTHLKAAVDEVRACGQYVFWRDDVRMRGYTSQYYRRANTRSKTPAPEAESATETRS